MPHLPRHLSSATVVVLAIAGTASPASAHPSSTTEEPRVYALDLQPSPAMPSGKAAGAAGTVAGAGHRFQLEHLILTQPVAVAAIAEDPSRPLDVRLAKFNFDSPERQGRTDSRGQVSFQFRTEGDLLIQVRPVSGEPAPYSLVVWVGDDVATDVQPPFVAMKKRSRLDGFPWLNAPFGAGVLGGLVCAAVVVFLWRPLRRRRDGAIRQSGVGLLIVSLTTTVAGSQFVEANVRALAGKELEKALKEAGLDTLIGGANAVKDAVALAQWHALSPFDSSLDQDAPEAPELPSNCLNSTECRTCFAPPNARLKVVMGSLEKLRRYGAWTKTYKDRAITFGNSLASLPYAGLGWPGARQEIEDGYARFQAAYDAKYKELIASLKSALQEVSACEESVYQEHDWYHRFGFIYYQFMAERYRRTD